MAARDWYFLLLLLSRQVGLSLYLEDIIRHL
jgi:hypothetical protein